MTMKPFRNKTSKEWVKSWHIVESELCMTHADLVRVLTYSPYDSKHWANSTWADVIAYVSRNVTT